MPTDFRSLARQKAAKYGLLPDVFERQIDAESGFNPKAVSSAGARGIAQIMPSTAKGWNVNPDDPHAALDAAAKNMASYVRTYGGMGTADPTKVRGAYEKALQAYNAGPGSVGRYLPEETKGYISKIIGPDKYSFTQSLQGQPQEAARPTSPGPNVVYNIYAQPAEQTQPPTTQDFLRDFASLYKQQAASNRFNPAALASVLTASATSTPSSFGL
jgi:hypothetical protein